MSRAQELILMTSTRSSFWATDHHGGDMGMEGTFDDR